MKYLLDVSTLMALVWRTHADHGKARAWRAGKEIVLCPLSELGLVRVSSSSSFNLTVADARQLLADFVRDESPEWIPADLRVLDGREAPSSGKTTDWYLADLAAAHKMKWATLDAKAKHPSAELLT